MAHSSATKAQMVEIVNQLGNGRINGKLAQALIEGRVEIVEKPREQKGTPYRGDVAGADSLPNHYRLHVSYAKLPGVAALEERFSEDGVSYLYDGRSWKRHSSCATIDETPGEREFFVAEIPTEFLGKRIDTVEGALAEHYDRLGYRFAIETETVEFADAQPELQRKNWIYALGSSALDDVGGRCVTMLDADDRDRVLRGDWGGRDLSVYDRLLLVRKVSSAL